MSPAPSVRGPGVSFLNRFLPEDDRLRLDFLTFTEFKKLLINQNAGRRLDDGDEASKRGELVPLYYDAYRQNTPGYQIVGVRATGAAAGCCAFGVTQNSHRAAPRNHYARIDIVITGRFFRQLGFGKLLVYTVLDLLLEQRGRELYSISCVCAHQAIARMLQKVGWFTFVQHECKGTSEAVCAVTDESAGQLRTAVAHLCASSAREALYHYRQRVNTY